MSEAQAQAAARRAASLARLEGHDYTLWLVGSDGWWITSALALDEQIYGYYATVTQAGMWSGPNADRITKVLAHDEEVWP